MLKNLVLLMVLTLPMSHEMSTSIDILGVIVETLGSHGGSLPSRASQNQHALWEMGFVVKMLREVHAAF